MSVVYYKIVYDNDEENYTACYRPWWCPFYREAFGWYRSRVCRFNSENEASDFALLHYDKYYAKKPPSKKVIRRVKIIDNEIYYYDEEKEGMW